MYINGTCSIQNPNMADQTTVPGLALSAGFVMFYSLYAFYYIEDITRWCEDMKLFYFRVAKQYFMNEHSDGWWGQCESSKPSLYVPRFRAIVDLIANQTPSLHVVCLQEFWFHDDVMDLFHAQFDKKYRIVKLKRTGFKTDGLAILVDRSISILSINPIHFNDMNRRVALLLHLLLPEEEEVIVMTTHLTYCSNFIDQYLRMFQIKKARSEIENYQKKNNVEHIPVILAGDFNGCPKDAVYSHVMESGFFSSYQSVHNREPHVTHRVYNGEEILVDYIFFRNSSSSHLVPKTSTVLPAEYSDEEWPKDFTLSDHRMIMTEFELQTLEKEQSKM